MAINQNIGTFINVASRRDFARDNLFRVMQLNTRGLSLSEDDLVYCKGAKMSGREVPHSEPVKYMGMDLYYPQSTVKYPDAGEYSLDFYLDASGHLREKFEIASRVLFNDATSTGDWSFPSISDTLTLAALDFNLEPQEYITYYGVSIKTIGDYDTKAAEGQGVAMSIPVNFTYLYYRRNGSDVVFDGF